MKNPTLKAIIRDQLAREGLRRELQQYASQALSTSKRAIFALQRDDRKAADAEVAAASKLLDKGRTLIRRDTVLGHEGVWRAALEEFTEAELFRHFVTGGELDDAAPSENDPETVLGGLSDACGEMARYAVLRATEGDCEAVEKLYCLTAQVVQLLLHLDLTGSLRSKFDQAKQHLRKLEDVRYDLSRHCTGGSK